MRTIIWFIYFWLYLVAVTPLAYRVKRLRLAGETAAHDGLVARVVSRWASSLLRLAGATVTVEGLEQIPDEPVVFVCNHQGNFDIPVMLTSLGRSVGLVAKKEMESVPLVNGWMKELCCVFLDRENPRAAVSALNAAAAFVREGRSMVIFPEGTRSPDGEIGEYKGGAFKIAQKNGVKIVPMVIDGTRNLMKKNSLWIHPAAVTLRILPPLETEGFSKEDWRALPATCEAITREALAVLRAEQTEKTHQQG